MEIEPVRTEAAPPAIGPYSQGVRAGRYLFTSGQLPMTPAGELIVDDVREAARQAFSNLRAVLAAARADIRSVAKVTIYLVRMEDFAAVNAVYAETFSEPYPARSTIGVKSLPKGSPLEVEAIALIEG